MIRDRDLLAYLNSSLGPGTTGLQVTSLAADAAEGPAGGAGLKSYGYGRPLHVRYQRDGVEGSLVITTMAASGFGHEFRADRAAALIQAYDRFNQLPGHVPALDVGVVHPEQGLISLGGGGEFFLVTPFVPGRPYADDLVRIRNEGRLQTGDLERAEGLARTLARMHRPRHEDAAAYRRHLRDTVGSGEGIFGLTDSYPPNLPYAPADRLDRIEERSRRWRRRMAGRSARCTTIHGDFHPYNLLFEPDGTLHILDRSRSPRGEAADDVVALVINYLFFSLQRSGRLAPPFDALWARFWHVYLSVSGDDEILELVAPFFAWRALVLASPRWYRTEDAVRGRLLDLAEALLEAPSLDPARINQMHAATPVLTGGPG